MLNFDYVTNYSFEGMKKKEVEDNIQNMINTIGILTDSSISKIFFSVAGIKPSEEEIQKIVKEIMAKIEEGKLILKGMEQDGDKTVERSGGS